jgi:hypothetical protein
MFINLGSRPARGILARGVDTIKTCFTEPAMLGPKTLSLIATVA